MANMGGAVPRLDARQKVTGKASYAADLAIDNLAYAVLVTSAIAKGRISKLKLDAARMVPGVLDILSYKDAKIEKHLKSIGNSDQSEIRPLSSSKIWHDGQIIAVVVADSFEAARESAYKVAVDYKARKPSATFDSPRTKTEAARGAVDGHDDPRVGRAAAAMAASNASIDVEYETAAQHHNPIELFSTTCVWEGDRLTIYEPSQFVNGLRRGVAEQLKIKYVNIRVLSTFVGGGFGSKGSITARTALIALVARRLKRPVRLVVTRDQGFTVASYRAETRHRVRLGADRDGKLKALMHEAWELTSRPDAYFNGGTETTCRMYAVPNVWSKVSIVHADRNTPGYMRAPAEFPYVYALETAMDELAVKLRIDPIEFRRINDTMSDPIFPHAPYTSRSLMQCFDQAANAFDWRRRDPNPGAMRDGEWLTGWGCATAVYPTQTSPAAARVTLTRQGQIRVDIGAHELGTGAMTVIAQTAAERLGIAVENVHVELGDSSLPPGSIAAGSATTASSCSVILKACDAIRERLDKAGRTATLAARFDRLGIHLIEEYAEWIPPGFGPDALKDLHTGNAYPQGGAMADRLMFAFGAEFVEVRIHTLTREIRVPRIVGAFAAGRIVNPRTARSQLMGGMIWGISSALYEQSVIDRKGARYVNDNFGDYLIPVNADIEKVEVILVPEHDPAVNPAGVKGLGELGNVGTAAAISNAIYHATGKRIRKLPICVEDLL